MHLLKLEPGRAENCRVFIGERPGRDESDDRLWLQAWRQQLLQPGACSCSWLAFRYVLIRLSQGHKHMRQVLSECTQRPKGQLCAPSVSKRIRISGVEGSCLGSGASPWVIRRGCQGRVGWRGRGRWGANFSYLWPSRPTPLHCHRSAAKLTLTTWRNAHFCIFTMLPASPLLWLYMCTYYLLFVCYLYFTSRRWGQPHLQCRWKLNEKYRSINLK